MKYTGRIIAIGLVIGTFTFEILYKYFIKHGFDSFELLLTVIYLPISWWLGKQYDRAKFYSEKDSLTGLYNRHFILQAFPRILTRMNGKGNALSLFILDCNNFKYTNDTYGHEMGDMVLKSIADRLRRCAGSNCLIARFGGDEFLLIAPRTGSSGAKVIKNRIAKELYQLSKEMNQDISASIGYALYPDHGKSLDNLIKAADDQMYQNKAKTKRESRLILTNT